MKVILVDPDELRTLIREVVTEVVSEAMKAKRETEELPEFLDTPALRKFTGWNQRQIQYRREHGLPFVQHGRMCMYRTQDVLDYIEEGRINERRVSKNTADNFKKGVASDPVDLKRRYDFDID